MTPTNSFRWRDHARRYIDDRTRAGFSAQYLRMFRSALGSFLWSCRRRHPEQVTVEDAERWLNQLAERGRKGRPVSARTLNNYASMMRSHFEWTNVRGTCDRNAFLSLTRAKEARRRGRVLEPDEVVRIVQAAEEAERDPECRYGRRRGRVVVRSVLYAFLYVTGMRIGSAERLRVSHYDARTGTVHVPGELVKNHESLEIPLGVSMVRAMDRWVAGRAPDAPLFERPRAEWLRQDAERAGVPVRDAAGRGIGFHAFRHSSATHIAAANFNASVVQRRLGHLDIRTTLKVYTHEKLSAGRDQQRLASQVLENHLTKNDAGNPQHGLTRGGGGPDDVSVTPNSPNSYDSPERASHGVTFLGSLGVVGANDGIVGPGRSASVSGRDDAPEEQWAQQDSNLSRSAAPGRDALESERISTVRRMLDYLEAPGRTDSPRERGGQNVTTEQQDAAQRR